MKASALLATGLLVFMSVGQVTQADAPDWHLHVSLVDGSRLIGVPKATALKGDLPFGELDIPFKRIRRVEYRDAGKTIHIELTNDDVLTGKNRLGAMQLETIFGRVTPQPGHCKSFDMSPTCRTTVAQWLLKRSLRRSSEGVM